MNWLTETEQFTRGKSVERWLDRYFTRKGFKIKATTKEQERSRHLGDRIFNKGDQQLFVEYKSGIQTHYTGNVFIETVSVDNPARFTKGWALTCQADYLMYAALLDGLILVIKPDELRTKLNDLQAKFPTKKTSKQQNNGYNTHGILVPLDYAIEHLAVKVIRIKQ